MNVTVTVPDGRQVSLLRQQFPQQDAIVLIPEALARKHTAIPVVIRDGTLLVAIANPGDIFALEALAAQSRMRVEPHPATRQEILDAIDLNYKAYDEIERKVSSISLPDEDSARPSMLNTVTDAPIAQSLTLIIKEAAKARASDIHFQPQEDRLQVRYRIDGTLHNVLSLPQKMAAPLISRIKIVGNMNIADHHRTQDGQFSFETGDRTLGIRVGSIPTVYGEMAVLRLLDKSRSNLDLSELGFLPENLEQYQKMLKVPYGMILVSGPTGAGKTTTLYASLNCLNNKEQNIITIEDPVEFRFENINQIQVNTRAGLDFSSGLRAILRLDPDVILVGEIRDAETAQIAIQGALTGHLVLSSIHANDAISVVSRLMDLGVEPFLISSALIGIIAQRMVRRVCPYCAQPVAATAVEEIAYRQETGKEKTEFLHGSGCQACSNTGYQGRTGIFELLQINDTMRKMLLSGADIAELRNRAIDSGMIPLVKDGMIKAGDGITSTEEVLRNVHFSE
jgi:general secretion pathway protein E